LDHVIVHARKAYLNGISPKQNRTIPPLNYERVYMLHRIIPKLHITINGGITTVELVKQQLDRVNGVMIGRECEYH
jgi:tRNA-dihydrouridine synthase A